MLRVDAKDTLPITLRHERIYILPSKRGLAFFGVVTVMLVASMNYGLNLGYALSFILIGLFASCLLATYMNIAQLQMAAVTTTDTFAGDSLEFDITMREKNSRYRHSITVTDASGAKDTNDLKPNTTATANLHLANSQRGVYALGRLTISSDFPLGLWQGWGYVHAKTSGHVYPKAETPASRFVKQATIDDGPIAHTLNEREFKQLKPYQKTDSPASIAWKAVARGTGWFSKEFESQSSTGELILRWQDTPATLDAEQRLSRLCGWVLEAEKSATDYSLELPDGSIVAGQGHDHYQQCLRQLAKFTASPND